MNNVRYFIWMSEVIRLFLLGFPAAWWSPMWTEQTSSVYKLCLHECHSQNLQIHGQGSQNREDILSHVFWWHPFTMTSVDVFLRCFRGSDMPSQGRQPSPYLRRSPSLSGTHSQGDMCSCNSPGCFCISHCHKAAGLPSTRQCLQAVSRRQEVDMVTGT